MTFVEKALERLNTLIKQSAEGSDEHTDYVVMKQACEKQVEKKPEKGRQEDIFSSRLIGYVCPSCNEFVGVYHTIKKEMTEKSDYCRRCGQRIDWVMNNEMQ